MRIGICAIASPLEIPYLREWFDHHHEMGVNDFILFLNDWTPFDMAEFNKLFWREMNDKTIHPVRLDGAAMQYPAYNQGTALAEALQLDWCAFIDIDEFMAIRSNRSLQDILSTYSDIPSLVLRWRLFSSGGQETVPVNEDGTKNYSVKRFTKCCPRLEELTKQFINLRYLRNNSIHPPHWTNPHFSSLMGGYDQRRRFQFGGRTRFTDEVDELELNHYWSKSKEECRIRRSHRRSCDAKILPWEKDYEDHLKRCTIDESELHWRYV